MQDNLSLDDVREYLAEWKLDEDAERQLQVQELIDQGKLADSWRVAHIRKAVESLQRDRKEQFLAQLAEHAAAVRESASPACYGVTCSTCVLSLSLQGVAGRPRLCGRASASAGAREAAQGSSDLLDARSADDAAVRGQEEHMAAEDERRRTMDELMKLREDEHDKFAQQTRLHLLELERRKQELQEEGQRKMRNLEELRRSIRKTVMALCASTA
jgi:hypothetical protein